MDSRATLMPQPPRAVVERAAHLSELVAAVRAAVDRHGDWTSTAEQVANQLRRTLPSPSLLTAEQRNGRLDAVASHLLYVEPDGAFSILAIVLRPGQRTSIHDHVTWCAVGVVQGSETEELFSLSRDGARLTRVGTAVNRVREVVGFAPPGDIHRVANTGSENAISIHIYGTDIRRVGSSVRRSYDLPVKDAVR